MQGPKMAKLGSEYPKRRERMSTPAPGPGGRKGASLHGRMAGETGKIQAGSFKPRVGK